MQEYQLYIDGEFCAAKAGKTLESINPATEEPWARVARAGREDTQRAIQAARKAFDEGPWPRMSQADRAKILNQIADGLQARAQEIAVVETQDSGGTIRKTGGDLMLGQRAAPLLRRDGREAAAADRDPGAAVPGAVEELRPARAVRRLRPDHPVELPAHDGGVEDRPGARDRQHRRPEARHRHACSAFELAEIIDKTDLPKGVVNVIHGSGAECGEELCTSPLVDKVAFTGSTAVGRRIMQLASDTVKKVTLELGGKSANIILDDADLDMADRRLALRLLLPPGPGLRVGHAPARLRGACTTRSSSGWSSARSSSTAAIRST